MASLRAAHLQRPAHNWPGLAEEEAYAEAIRQIGVNLDIPSLRADFVTYVKTGVRTPAIYDFTKEPDPSDPTNPAYYKNRDEHSLLRDWLVEPLLRIPAAGAQGIVNLGAGVANLFGADLTPPEMESAFYAALRKYGGDTASMRQLRAEEAARLQAYEESRGVGQQIVQGSGTVVGTVVGFTMNMALRVGATVGGWAVRAALNIGKNPTLMQKVGLLAGRGAGGFGTLEALQQPTGTEPLTLEERAHNALIGAVTGPAYELTGQAGKAAFFKLMRSAGRDGEALSTAVAKWAREKGIGRATEDGETKEQFFKRAIDAWVADGTPGLAGTAINTKKAVALAGQALVEALGFSAIDAKFREDLTAAWLDQDQEAWERVVIGFAGNALGMWFLHAGGKLNGIPRLQRQFETDVDGRIVPVSVLTTGARKSTTPTRVLDPIAGFDVQALPNEPQQVTSIRELTRLPDRPTPLDPVELQREAQRSIFLRNHLWRFGWAPATPEQKHPQEPPGITPPGGVRPTEPPREDPAVLRNRMLAEIFRQTHFARWGWAPAEVKGPPTGTEPTAVPSETPPRKPEPIESGQATRFELPDSPYGFEIRAGDAVPNEALREALGSPVRVPVALFADYLHKASLLSALHSKTRLPGQEVSVEGVYGEGDLLRTIRYGEYLERTATVDSRWRPAGTVPERGRDELQPKQHDLVLNLQNAAKRQDLEPADRSLLGGVVETLRTVAAEKDQSVQDTLAILPDLTRQLQDPNPQVAAEAVRTMAESLTTTGPEVLKAREEARKEAEKEAAEAAKRPPNDFYVLIKNQSGETEGVFTTAKTEAEAITEALSKVPGEVVLVEDLSTAPPSRPSEAFGGLVPPEIARAVTQAVVGGSSGARDVFSKLLDAYERSLIRRVEDAGARTAAAMGRASDLKTRELRAENKREGQRRYEELTQRPNRELERKLYDGKGAITTVLEAKLDEKLGQHFGADKIRLSKEAQEIVDLAHKLIVHLAKVANREGIGFLNAEGGLTGDPNLWRKPRRLTPEGREAMLDPRSEPRRVVAEWLQNARGMEPQEAEAQLAMFESISRHDPAEFRRVIEVLPSRFELPDGKEFRLLEDLPRSVSGILDSGAYTLGARSVFRDTPIETEGLTPEQRQAIIEIPDGAQRVLAEVSKQYGREAMLATKDMLKALHGLPLSDAPGFTRPGTRAHDFMRVVMALLNLNKAGKLSLAFINNSLSAPQHLMHVGVTRMAKAWSDFGRDFTNGRLADEVMRLESDGWLVRHTAEKRVKGETRIETFENATRRLGEILTKPLDVAQGVLEVVLAKSAENALAEMQRGNGGQVDRSMLFSMGFRPDQIERMVNGKGTAEEYAQYRTNAVSTLEAGRAQTAADKPTSAHSKLFDNLVWFQNFFRHRVRILRGYADEMAAAKTPAEKGLVSGKIAIFLAANSLGGFATQIVKKWLKGESFGDWLRETQQNPLDAMGTVLISGLFGAGGGIFYEAGRGIFTGQNKEEFLGGLAVLLGPFGAAYDVIAGIAALAGADMPGYEGMTQLQKVGKFVRTELPAAQSFHRGLFGIAALALSDRPPELQSAFDAVHRWERKRGIPRIRSDRSEPDRRAWLDAMRKVMAKVEAGGQWGEVELMDALEEADIFGEDQHSIARSLRARKTFSGDLDPTSESYNEEKGESLRAYLGPDHTDTLEAFDATLEYLAERWERAHK
jgi:hypothetical protein